MSEIANKKYRWLDSDYEELYEDTRRNLWTICEIVVWTIEERKSDILSMLEVPPVDWESLEIEVSHLEKLVEFMRSGCRDTTSLEVMPCEATRFLAAVDLTHEVRRKLEKILRYNGILEVDNVE